MTVTAGAPSRFISTKELCNMLSVQTLPAVLAMVRAGTLPPPLRLSPRILRWNRAAVEAALVRLAEQAASAKGGAA